MTTDIVDSAVPVVADLDGTVIRTDLLFESFWKGLGAAPVQTVLAAVRYLGNRPKLKQEMARIAPVDAASLPINADVAAFLDRARSDGRQVLLASGSTASMVEKVAEAHGPFTRVLGSDDVTNLTAERKAARLVEMFGEGRFDYIGDSAADIPVWRVARQGFVAGPSPRFSARLAAAGLSPVPIGESWNRLDLLKGLRPHQWLKNLLLILPLIASHRAGLGDIWAVFLGFVAFSALASSIYIVNDLTDLEADRLHDTKRNRPFASGRVPIKAGMAASLGLALIGLGIGAAMGWAMLAVLLVYLVSTTSYSMHLKRVRWADVTMLAGLYTLRVVAGAVAAGVPASGWLFGFIFPVFLSLGCVKRLTELAKAKDDGFVPGRRYRRADRDDLLNVAILAALGAVSVFFAYSLSETASELYDHIWMLWAVAALLGLWLARMIRTGWTGRQDYDPIIYAITDKLGLGLVASSVLLLVLASS